MPLILVYIVGFLVTTLVCSIHKMPLLQVYLFAMWWPVVLVLFVVIGLMKVFYKREG